MLRLDGEHLLQQPFRLQQASGLILLESLLQNSLHIE